MLRATRELIRTLRAPPTGALSTRILTAARAGVVARHGTAEDAHALLDLFLEAPADDRRAVVLDAVMRAGDDAAARRLAAAYLAGGRLKPDVQPEVLHALGFLGFADAREVLWGHAREADYYVQRAAALGLLNLPCDGLERAIEDAIRGCVGESLFAEFLPALACKVGNPDLLGTIFDIGQTTASADCNAGIVYGVALFGDAGRPYFERLLFDPLWAAHGGGTGTQLWAYHGFRHLDGSLARLAGDARALLSDAGAHAARVWLAVAECWLEAPLPPRRGERYAAEAAADVYRAAFDRSAGADDSLTRFDTPGAYDLRERLADRVAAEVARDEAN